MINLNIDVLAFILAVRRGDTIEAALRASPGHRPLTEDELVHEAEQARARLVGPDGQLVADWDKKAGAL